MNKTGEFWHVPVWEHEKTKERVILLRDFNKIEQDMYDHLVASIKIHGVGEKAFREFERRNGLKKFEHTRAKLKPLKNRSSNKIMFNFGGI